MKQTILFTLFAALSFSVANAQVPSYVPTDGLVGWWPFNGDADDESGNGNDGTVNGATFLYASNNSSTDLSEATASVKADATIVSGDGSRAEALAIGPF